MMKEHLNSIKKGVQKGLDKTISEVVSKGKEFSEITSSHTTKITSEVKEKIADTTGLMKETLKNVSDKGKQVSVAANENLNIISGKKILDEVKERLEQQDRYNDVLATKLQEVMERLSRLESKLEEGNL